MRRTDLLDTRMCVHKEIVRRLRAMTPEERLMRTFELCEANREMFGEQTRQIFIREQESRRQARLLSSSIQKATAESASPDQS